MQFRVLSIVLRVAALALLLAGCVEQPSLRVERVVDGDTFELSGDLTVRLIGIDTPEKYMSDKLARDARRTGRDIEVIQALGRKASRYAQHLVDGKPVELEFDPANRADNHRDRYGRLLAYVWVLDNEGNRLFRVNDRLIRDGYAHAYTRYPFKYRDTYLELQREARHNDRGLWGEGLSADKEHAE
jgi:micrococcal nuclease